MGSHCHVCGPQNVISALHSCRLRAALRGVPRERTALRKCAVILATIKAAQARDIACSVLATSFQFVFVRCDAVTDAAPLSSQRCLSGWRGLRAVDWLRWLRREAERQRTRQHSGAQPQRGRVAARREHGRNMITPLSPPCAGRSALRPAQLGAGSLCSAVASPPLFPPCETTSGGSRSRDGPEPEAPSQARPDDQGSRSPRLPLASTLDPDDRRSV